MIFELTLTKFNSQNILFKETVQKVKVIRNKTERTMHKCLWKIQGGFLSDTAQSLILYIILHSIYNTPLVLGMGYKLDR